MQGLRLEQAQRLRQSLRPEQKLELKLALIEQVKDILVDIGVAGGIDDPAILIKGVIDKVINSTEPEERRKALKLFFGDERVMSSIIENMESLAVLTQKRITDLILNYIYKHDSGDSGSFNINETNEKGEVIGTTTCRTTKPDFKLAYVSPDKAQKDLDDKRKLAESLTSSAVGGALIDEIENLNNAIKVVGLTKKNIDTMIEIVTYILVKRGKDGTPELGNFIRDAVVLRKLTSVESDRLLNRFVTRCEGVRQKNSPDDVKEDFLNTVGEFVLIAMGIVGQEMFVLKKGEVDRDVYEKNKKELADLGINLDKVMDHYKLTKGGTFFWHSWKTLDRTPSTITDNKVRDFITKTVRADEGEVLGALEYDVLIKSIKDINFDKTVGIDERREAMQELFIEYFSSSKFKDTVVNLIKTKWYQQLETFY